MPQTGMVSTKENFQIKPSAFHLNAGYSRNENKLHERKDLWSASLAATYEAFKGLRLVGDIGFTRSADPTAQTNPAFTLIGLNYAVNNHIILDAGFKFGLNKQEMDRSITAGVTFNF